MQAKQIYAAVTDRKIAQDLASVQSVRDASFPAQLFSDPSWNILLALYLNQDISGTMPAAEACAAAGVPASAALRWIMVLEDNGMVTRTLSDDAANDGTPGVAGNRVGLTNRALDHFTEMFRRIRDFR